MKKSAKPQWASVIESDLRSGVITNLNPDIQRILSKDNIVYDSGPPSEEPQARAYVTTEDADENGNNDTIHMVVTNIERDIPEIHKLHSFEKGSPEYQSIISSINQVLEHENAHLRGGDEAAAEAAERIVNPQFRVATNISADHSKVGKSFLNLDGDIKMNKELIALANRLDSMGHVDLADMLDSVIKSAQVMYDPNAGLYDPYADYLTGPEESLADPHGLGEIGDMTFERAYHQYSGINWGSVAWGHPGLIWNRSTPGNFSSLQARRGEPLNNVWLELVQMSKDSNDLTYAAQFIKTVSKAAGIVNPDPRFEGEGDRPDEQERIVREEEVLRPTRVSGSSNQDIEDIQSLVGATPDGVWGPNTRSKVLDFLRDREEYILGGTADDVLATGQGNFGVRGGKPNPGDYSQNWGGMLEFLRDLDEQRAGLMASLEESLVEEQDRVAREGDITEVDFSDRDPEEGVIAGPRTVNPADDMEVEASSTDDKINKIASTMDGIFTPRVNGLVRR